MRERTSGRGTQPRQREREKLNREPFPLMHTRTNSHTQPTRLHPANTVATTLKHSLPLEGRSPGLYRAPSSLVPNAVKEVGGGGGENCMRGRWRENSVRGRLRLREVSGNKTARTLNLAATRPPERLELERGEGISYLRECMHARAAVCAPSLSPPPPPPCHPPHPFLFSEPAAASRRNVPAAPFTLSRLL